jgi:hypothetical protein
MRTGLIVCLLVVGCSDSNTSPSPDASSCPDTAWMTWQQVRAVEAKLQGTPCVGAASCQLLGCAPPGDRCYCDKGTWVCVHTDCKVDVRPWPDLRADRPSLPDLRADQAKTDAPATFSCGALLTCKTAAEYCERTSAGACGGSPPSDAGTCPPNCSPTSCGGKQVCVCTGYACKPLPAGCSSCACLGATGGCTCSQGSKGELNVHCAMP